MKLRNQKQVTTTIKRRKAAITTPSIFRPHPSRNNKVVPFAPLLPKSTSGGGSSGGGCGCSSK